VWTPAVQRKPGEAEGEHGEARRLLHLGAAATARTTGARRQHDRLVGRRPVELEAEREVRIGREGRAMYGPSVQRPRHARVEDALARLAPDWASRTSAILRLLLVLAMALPDRSLVLGLGRRPMIID
jgi:hypothetical protein